MNKIILKSATLLTVVATISPILASADTVNYETSAGITIVPSTAITPPLDPETPTDPVTPVDPGGEPVTPGTPGPLSIDFASSLEFGTQEIASGWKTYYAHPQMLSDEDGNITGTRELYAQVTDNRGTGEGWTLAVTADSQLHLSGIDPDVTPEATASPGDYMTGAQIFYHGGRINNVNGTAPSIMAYSGSISTNQMNLMHTFAAGEGMGTTIFSFGTDSNGVGDYDSSSILTGSAPFVLPYAPIMQTHNATQSPVSLSIPDTAVLKAGRYTTTLNWTLSQQPDA